MRGTPSPITWANFIGEPKYVSTSIGRLAAKSWYIMLFDSEVRIISAMIVSLKFAGNLHSCASAICKSSSMTSEINDLTPTFSSRAVCEGVSKITLIGWNAIGLFWSSSAGWTCLEQQLRFKLTLSSFQIAVAGCCVRPYSRLGLC